MGHSSSRLVQLRRALRANSANVVEVDLSGEQLSDRAVRKLSEALAGNKLAIRFEGGGAALTAPLLPRLVSSSR